MSNYRLSFPADRAEARGITKQQWGVLVNSTFPGVSSPDAILNAWDLALVKGLDVFGGHVAIVVQSRKVDGRWVDEEASWLTLKALVYMAHQTGSFAGIDPITFGPMVSRTYEGYRRSRGGENEAQDVKITVPEYVTATVYRFVNGQRCAFSDTIFFDEMVSLTQNIPTAIWRKKPALMLAKCAKAAALRLGFAECDYSAEEMDGQETLADVVPDGSSQVHGSAAAQGGETRSLPATTGLSEAADPFAGSAFREPPADFDGLPVNALRWLDRTTDTAVNLGAFDEALDNLKASMDADYHPLGEKLIRSAQAVSGCAKAQSLWRYIGSARNRGGDTFDQAKTAIHDQVPAGHLTAREADAAEVVLAFLKALSRAA